MTITNLAGQHHLPVLMDSPTIAYRDHSGNLLTARNRYAPYTLPSGSTSTSSSIGQLTHLTSQPHHFQYWPQTTQYASTLQQPLQQQTRLPTVCGSQAFQQTSLQATGSSQSLTGSSCILPQHRQTALTYNAGYSTVTSTTASPSYNGTQPHLQPSPTLERLPNQTAFSPRDTTTYGSQQISQQQQPQHWPQAGFP